MARPRSEDKRNTILAAATQVFAARGLSASTASISAAAGLAEGTLFIYFKGKDELINSLYEVLKQDLGDAILAGYPRRASVRARAQHVWNNYVDWGVKNPDQLAVMHKIKVWEGLDPKVRESTAARFEELHQLIESATIQGVMQDLPQPFLMAMMSAQIETTIQFIRAEPSNEAFYKEKGFEMYWNGMTRKK